MKTTEQVSEMGILWFVKEYMNNLKPSAVKVFLYIYKELLSATNNEKEILLAEIQEGTRLTRMTVYLAIKKLESERLITRRPSRSESLKAGSLFRFSEDFKIFDICIIPHKTCIIPHKTCIIPRKTCITADTLYKNSFKQKIPSQTITGSMTYEVNNEKNSELVQSVSSSSLHSSSSSLREDLRIRIREDLRKKNTKEVVSEAQTLAFELARLFFKSIRQYHPTFTEPNLKSWALDFDRLLRKDKRNPEKIKHVISWAHKDPFWKKVVLSPSKLMKHYDRLALSAGEAPQQADPDNTSAYYQRNFNGAYKLIRDHQAYEKFEFSANGMFVKNTVTGEIFDLNTETDTLVEQLKASSAKTVGSNSQVVKSEVARAVQIKTTKPTTVLDKIAKLKEISKSRSKAPSSHDNYKDDKSYSKEKIVDLKGVSDRI